ncbi:MAG: TatD family hydrolase [Pseudanabaenaceae cyanobacterium SKYG29]|nr:TatD family hydrolase [Pseudanabaenaceae cyanobacterium SKYG29]
MPLVDTHVHINFPEFVPDLADVQQRWRAAGITYLVHSCVHPREFPQLQTLADRLPEVYIAVGLHPLDTELNQTGWRQELGLEVLRLAGQHPKVVAIGETGLDFYKAAGGEAQRQAFWTQLTVAAELNLPVIIHCREAAQATRELIREFNRSHPAVRGVMHCWSGTPEETRWFLDLGLYISFSGIVTFKNARSVQESVLVVPDDRLLVETDCPYLAPVPWRGKRNEPSYVVKVAEKVAALRQQPLGELAAQTTTNACKLFNLPSPATDADSIVS